MPVSIASISPRLLLRAFLALGPVVIFGGEAFAQTGPLPSWNDSAARKSIVDFVARVTTQGGADFVPVLERIATFDNDRTLWTEQPVCFQLAFAFDQALDEATAKGWTVVDMKQDWKVVFSPTNTIGSAKEAKP